MSPSVRVLLSKIYHNREHIQWWMFLDYGNIREMHWLINSDDHWWCGSWAEIRISSADKERNNTQKCASDIPAKSMHVGRGGKVIGSGSSCLLKTVPSKLYTCVCFLHYHSVSLLVLSVHHRPLLQINHERPGARSTQLEAVVGFDIRTHSPQALDDDHENVNSHASQNMPTAIDLVLLIFKRGWGTYKPCNSKTAAHGMPNFVLIALRLWQA